MATKKDHWLIQISNTHELKPKQATVKSICSYILDNFEIRDQFPDLRHLSIVFTSDTEIHKLNKEYRGKNKPTDVLSFSLLEGESGELSPSFGDIVISLDTAKKQAKENKHSLSMEVLTLLTHGLLHLLGYDHEKVPKKDATMMFKLQDTLVESLKSKKIF